MIVDVQCYAGYRGEQEPEVIIDGDRRLTVMTVIDRWLAPDHRYFKVACDDGLTYILRHDNVALVWEIISMNPQ